MSNILKGQRGLAPILKSIKTTNKAREASKLAISKTKELKALNQEYQKTLSEAQKAEDIFNFYGGEAHYGVSYDQYNHSLSKRLNQLETQISNLEFELKLPISNPYALSNDYYWQYRKINPILQQSPYRLFGPLPPVEELPRYHYPTQEEIDELPFKQGGKLKSIF